MHAQAVLSLALAGLAMAAPQAAGPRPTPDGHWRPTPDHNWGTKTTTKTLTAYTTWCPEPTTLDFNGKKYTVTKATTLTITDCPCTVVETGKPAPPTTPAVLPPPKTTAPGSDVAPPPKAPGSPAPPSQPNSPPVVPNPPSPNPPSKVSGAEGNTAKFGLAVVAGAAIAGLMAL